MSQPEILATVKEYEREKIYRLNRRLDGLNELLETIDNTKIKLDNPNNLKQNINRDILVCKDRIQKWWNIIFAKYNLPQDKKVSVSFEDGRIYKI